jgi:plastocyanin
LVNGWREISVDLTKYNRESINTVGFFMSTQYGWDATRPFELNVDKMTLTTGNKFVTSGYARFIYGNGFPQDFWRIRWDVVLPTGTVLKARTRTSNVLADFDPLSTTQPAWSAYNSTSGFEITGNGTLYSYIQIEVAFEANTELTASPELLRLYLDRKVSADSSGFTYNEEDQWSAGSSFNLDYTTVPGSIQIASLTDVNNVFYGGSGIVEQTDADMNVVFSDIGASLPLSTRQALAGESAGFGQLSAVKRGEDDTVWVADTDNDRVLQIDKSGNIIFGLWGSFLEEPIDTYGNEESGPGSNTDAPDAPAAPDLTVVPEALYAIYNPNVKKLWVVFSGNLEPVEGTGTTFDRNKMFLKAGANRVYFGTSTTFSLFGIDEDKYATWAMSPNEFLKQFTFYSHILEAELSQADAAALASVASFDIPSIAVSTMGENELVDSDTVSISFVTPNFDIGGESSDNNGIRIRLNGGTYSYYRTRTIILTAPSVTNGSNTLVANLVDGNNNVLDNEEVSCSLSFISDEDGLYENDPMIEVSSPRQGQTVSSLPVEVVFEARNHPILPVGSCIQYSLDDGAWVDHRSEDPIQITSLTGGRHSIDVRLADADGEGVVGTGTSVTVSFNYGTSSNSDLQLLIGAGTIRGASRAETTKTPEKLLSVTTSNIYFANLFCPVDLQVIPDETSTVNPEGNPTVLVAKLRSPSTTECLSLVGTTTSQIAAPSAPSSIFGTSYLDGHSVVQYSMTGAVLFSNNASKFSDTKVNSKIYLGSANKISSTDLIMADAIRQRAIIAQTDLNTGKPQVIWEYKSDRVVSDFQLANNDGDNIIVQDLLCNPTDVYIRTGTVVTWTNSSSMPIKIVSGTTNSTTFAADPDLTLYGDEFISQELQPGEQYARTFEDGGDFHWFSHPNIVTGIVHVSSGSTTSSDQYLVVEKDPISSVGGGRVLKLDAWGKIAWSFGDGVLYDPKDVRVLPNGSILIST